MSRTPSELASSATESSGAVGLAHMPPFPEWMELPGGAPIRQGDVLSALEEDDSIWHRLLVVITADCDLAKSKHDGALTCVPVLRLKDYLLTFRYEKMREQLSDRIVKEVLSSLRPASPEVDAPKISPARMRQWMDEEDPESIVDALGLLARSDRTIDLVRLGCSLCRQHPNLISGAIELLATAKTGLGDFKEVERARRATASELASLLSKLPGDVLYLNELSPAHTEGYVVYLRRVFEVTDSAVVTSYSRLPHDALYVRTSRLRAPYVYALTQQFATVFSAIGLPSMYEHARDAVGERIKAGEYS